MGLGEQGLPNAERVGEICGHPQTGVWEQRAVAFIWGTGGFRKR